MKKPLLILLIMICGLSLFATPSYFGLEGLNFIPSARIPNSIQFGFTSRAEVQKEIALFPYSYRINFSLFDFVEIALTNTSLYYSRDLKTELESFGVTTAGYVAPENYSLLFAPSFKIAFEDSAVPQGSLAVGFQLPYGAFLCFDYLIDILDPVTFHLIIGGGTTLSDLSGFGGIKISLPLNLDIMLEGGYRGQTTQLSSPQELFVSGGATQWITDNVACDFIWRYDQDETGRLMIGVHAKL